MGRGPRFRSSVSRRRYAGAVNERAPCTDEIVAIPLCLPKRCLPFSGALQRCFPQRSWRRKPRPQRRPRRPDDEEKVAELSAISVNEDPLRAISNEPSASSFGFAKPILETPRTVSFVSEEQISLLGISSADDLTRVVPGVYTNRRWGLQGGVDVRGVSADMYFRGMKRLNMQGHARTSLTGMDSIEVVKGPPSPIYGMGRIGGYTNMTPKAGRAKSGTYLPSAQGFAQLVSGAWDRSEVSFGVGGPTEHGREARRLLHLRFAGGQPGDLGREGARQAEDPAGRDQHRQLRRTVPARVRRPVSELEHRRLLHEPRDPGSRSTTARSSPAFRS